MYKQPRTLGITTAILCAMTLLSSSIAMADTLTVPNTFVPGNAATAASVNQNFNAVETEVTDNANDISSNAAGISTNATDIADNFSAINANTTDITDNFNALDQRLVPLEATLSGAPVPVNCTGDPAALKNLTLTPNTTYVLTGICDGQIIVRAGLGTINIEGDAIGIKDDGITLPPGETDPDSVFAAIYGVNGVRLNLTNLVINAASYNSEADLFIGGVGAFRTAHVVLNDVDVIGGDYGVGAYSGGQVGINSNVSITGFGNNGLVSVRASVIDVFDTVTITGGSSQDWTSSEAVGAYRGGIVEIRDDGNPATRHSITPASGPNLNISPDDNVAAVSAFANGTIRIFDADITGVVWSGDSSWVEVRNSVQGDGYVNPYRNSVLRFRGSQIGNGTAGEFYSGDFSVLRMDDTEVANVSGTEAISTYRYGVIDLRGATNLNGRDINCADLREVSIQTTSSGTPSGIGTIGC